MQEETEMANGKRTYTKPTAEMLEINYVETVTASNGGGASGGWKNGAVITYADPAYLLCP